MFLNYKVLIYQNNLNEIYTCGISSTYLLFACHPPFGIIKLKLLIATPCDDIFELQTEHRISNTYLCK